MIAKKMRSSKNWWKYFASRARISGLIPREANHPDFRLKYSYLSSGGLFARQISIGRRVITWRKV